MRWSVTSLGNTFFLCPVFMPSTSGNIGVLDLVVSVDDHFFDRAAIDD
jgi:hypothetical protein